MSDPIYTAKAMHYRPLLVSENWEEYNLNPMYGPDAVAVLVVETGAILPQILANMAEFNLRYEVEG